MKDIEALFRKCAERAGNDAKQDGQETPDPHLPVMEEKRIGPGMIRRRFLQPVIKGD